jgi:glycosyltransferase involved in cell wall biosynthesis
MNVSRPLVAFNAHLLAGDASYRSAGISVYIANLLQHLGQIDADFRFQVLLGDGVIPDDVSLPVTRARFSTRRPGRRIVWEQIILPRVLRRLGAGLLHAPAFVGPLMGSCRQVITVHDLSFLRYPEFFRPGNRLYLRTMTGVACRRADAVIAVSDFTAREVVELLGVGAGRVTTIYHGLAPRFRPLPEEDVARFRQEGGLPDRFVLFMGTLEPRKNLVQLVRAFARLQDPDLHLMLVGARGWYYESVFAEVERLGLADRVHFPGYVPAETQAFWYNAAHAFAYVSVYEGFGMPVLEALACGVPTLTSSTTSLPEVGGDAVVTAPPGDESALVESLDRVIHDVALRTQLRQQGMRRAASFSWDKAASQTADVYRSVLGMSRGAH